MNDPMSEPSQRAHIIDRFRLLFNRPELPVTVEWTADEEIIVNIGCENVWFVMTIGSDDDRYRFELWFDSRDTGVFVEFAFPGELLDA